MERKNIYQSDELQPAAWLCHHLFDRAPVLIYLFLSFIKSPMNDQSLKALNPSLFCEDFESREVEFWKFWSALVWLEVECHGGYIQKCTGSDPYVTNVTALIRINFFLFHFTISHLYTSFRADALSLTVLAPARVNYHVGSVSPTNLKSP